ncbi:hypothetical protein [Candidatus Paracaedibacter symbiosus]|uniref:hypothetical protein n=1 Tax=Candidatus Paracaedibacter symbiosus TaxID=244582 RepID=UPI0005093D8D|nr:hypothetical protein [Candidatus Paracaedibacter symbiosus]
MYSWSFLFRNLTSCQTIVGQQLRSVFVFLILYLLILLPMVKATPMATTLVLTQLLILQGICLITVVMQVAPSCSSDVHDGFLEKWLANQGLGFSYYLVRQFLILIEIILPAVVLIYLMMPVLPFSGTAVFLGISLTNAMIAALWSGSMALLLAGSHDISQTLVGMIMAILLLIPQILIGEVILGGVTTNTIASSHLWLYAGVSIVSVALNLGLVPTIVRLSLSS